MEKIEKTQFLKSVDLINLNKKFDSMQNLYGSKELNCVYGCGLEKDPEIVLVFMNPTKRNIATSKDWRGLRAQWLGTKQIWEFLTKCGLFDEALNQKIKSLKPSDWTEEFCDEVYNEVAKKKLWITNLAKCTQDDARPLSDGVFLKYKDLLFDELTLLNPKKIFLFGNQVASLVLDEKISVSTCRKQKFSILVDKKQVDAYAIFYPVGNGRFNQGKAIEDIKYITNK